MSCFRGFFHSDDPFWEILWIDGEQNKVPLTLSEPITVAARSKAWKVFSRSNTGIVGWNPTLDMDAYRCFSVFVLSCVYVAVLWRGLSPIQGVLPTV
jgi:hypothetical protein